MKKLTHLYLFNNPISDLTFNIIPPIKKQIYISNKFNLWQSLNDSINEFKEIYLFDNNLKHLNTIIDISNQKYEQYKRFNMFKYYKSSNLITLNNLFNMNCLQTIEFMKQRIHFNLFLNEQIDKFFLYCRKFEFD